MQPFLTSKEQDSLLRQLQESEFFNHFRYDAQTLSWNCTECHHAKLLPAMGSSTSAAAHTRTPSIRQHSLAAAPSERPLQHLAPAQFPHGLQATVKDIVPVVETMSRNTLRAIVYQYADASPPFCDYLLAYAEQHNAHAMTQHQENCGSAHVLTSTTFAQPTYCNVCNRFI